MLKTPKAWHHKIMSTYKTHFRKIALLGDRIKVSGYAEPACKKRIYGIYGSLNELDDFTCAYRECIADTQMERGRQPDGLPETPVVTQEMEWFRNQFLLKLEVFSYMTLCSSHDVLAAMHLDYEEIYTDIKHFSKIVDDRLHLDILDDLIEETEAYLEMMQTGKRRVHTPISKYLDEASKRSPYPESYAPDADIN
jgi:hypothetical protein